MNFFLNFYTYVFGRVAFIKINYLFIKMGLRGIGVLNHQSDLLSGENHFVSKVLKSIDAENRIIIDIGANEGNFTSSIINNSDNIFVKSFEPHPKTFARNRERFAMEDRVDVVNCAVGDVNDKISLFDYADEEGSSQASIHKEIIKGKRKNVSEIEVKMITLDSIDFIKKIELIKIDTEGAEYSVLKGANKTIETHKPKYILLEFNRMNVNSRVFLADFIALLKNYSAYRILPRGELLQIIHTSAPWRHEIFAYQNIVFILND